MSMVGLFFLVRLLNLMNCSEEGNTCRIENGLMIRVERQFFNDPGISHGYFDQIFISERHLLESSVASLPIDWSQVLLVNTWSLVNSDSLDKAPDGAICSISSDWKRIPTSGLDGYIINAKRVRLYYFSRRLTIGQYNQLVRDSHYSSNFVEAKSTWSMGMNVNVAYAIEICDLTW